MSLLQSAIGRGLEQLGDTASKGILMQAHQRHEDEMEQARALRAENLQRLNQQFQSAESEKQRKFTADQSNLTYNRTINSDFLINDRPATNAQLAGNEEANRQTGMINSAARERAVNSVDTVLQNPNLSPEEKQRILAQGEYTDAEQSTIGTYKGSAGKVSNVKQDAAATKAEWEQAKLQQKYENLKEITESKIASAKEIADAKLEMSKTLAEIRASKSSNLESRPMTKTEAAKTIKDLTKRRRDNNGLDEDEEALLERARSVVGYEVKGDTQSEPPKKKDKGFWGGVKSVFSHESDTNSTHTQTNDPAAFAGSLRGAGTQGKTTAKTTAQGGGYVFDPKTGKLIPR